MTDCTSCGTRWSPGISADCARGPPDVDRGRVMMTWHDVARCRSVLVRELHGLWISKRRYNELPRRADFEPAEMKRLLPNLLILDIEENPFRARYRLVGTKVVAASGFDFTGRYLDELELESGGEYWDAQYRAVYEAR